MHDALTRLWQGAAAPGGMARGDVVTSLVLAGAVVCLAVAYGVRVLLRGRARYERIDRHGGSRFLAKSVMEAAYWGIQPVAHALIGLGVTPNQLTWASFALGAGAGVCLAVGHFGTAAFIATVSALLDALDGLVARTSGKDSPSGVVLDSSIDRYVEFWFLGGVTLYYRPHPAAQALCLLALLGSFMVSYSTAKAEAMGVEPPKGSMRRAERAVYLIAGAALAPLSLAWLEPASSGRPLAYPMLFALAIVALAANGSAVFRLHGTAKRAEDARRLRLVPLRPAATAKSS